MNYRLFLVLAIFISIIFLLRFVAGNLRGGWLDAAILIPIAIGVLLFKAIAEHWMTEDFAVVWRRQTGAALVSADQEDLPALPAKSEMKVVEATAERLVFCISSGGRRAKAGLCVAVVWNISVAIWALGAGAGAGWLAHPFADIAVGGALFAWAAIKWNFERTFLLLDRKRLVVQHLLLGFKRFNETALAAGSFAELIPPQERGITFFAIRVRGQNGTARFGRTFAQETEEDNRWLVDRINDFLSRDQIAADGDAHPRPRGSHDLARDGVICVDECAPGILQFHYATQRPSPAVLGCLLAATVFAGLLWMLLVVFLTGMLFPPHLVPQYLTSAAILLAAVISAVAFYWWSRVFGRTTVSVRSAMLTCRTHLGWLDLKRTVVIPASKISDVNHECQGDVREPLADIEHLAQTVSNRSPTWSVALSGDEPLILPGFATESDAAEVALLLRTSLRHT